MASHLFDFLCDKERKNLIDCAYQKMKRIEDQFDFIAVRGISGVLLGSIMADRLNKKIAIVRKGGDDTHSHEKIECRPNCVDTKFAIVDDFISSGTTVNTIIDAISGAYRAKCVCIFCVNSRLQYNFTSKYHRNIPVIHCSE